MIIRTGFKDIPALANVLLWISMHRLISFQKRRLKRAGGGVEDLSADGTRRRWSISARSDGFVQPFTVKGLTPET